MSVDFETAIVAAALSSVFTIAAAKLWLDRFGEHYARRQLDLAAGELERRFRAAASQAAEEMLPELQRRVRAGFEEALQSFAAGKPFEKTMEQAAKAGPSRVERRARILDGPQASSSRPWLSLTRQSVGRKLGEGV